jgi:hypothetical protein
MLLLYQEDVRKRGEAILGAGPQPRLPQEERAGPEPVKPRPSRVWPLTPYRLRVRCGDRDVGRREVLEGERVREGIERDGAPRIDGLQFGFGQTCGAENGLTDFVGTFNCPFLVEARVLVLVSENVVVWDSTRLPPLLVQSMVAL